MSKDTDIAKMGYEQARDLLVETVAALEEGELTLEESMALWERGEKLAQRCQEHLDGAQKKLGSITSED